MSDPLVRDSATALLVVDMQHDFADPAGSLHVRGGEDLVEPIAAEIAVAHAVGATVVFTQDWHPDRTPHFARDGGLWPVHCVHDTPGAAFVPGLLPGGADPADGPDPLLRKGSGPEDGYSAFSVLDLTTDEVRRTALAGLLTERAVRELVVVGLAGDWCVASTAVDGVELGWPVTVPLALTRFVELRPGDGDAAVGRMRAAGVRVLPAEPS